MEPKNKYKVVQRGYTFNTSSTFKPWPVTMEDNQ